MMDPQIPEVEEVPSLLLPCASCGRTFRPEALAKHSKVCEKTLMKKRKQFDSAKQRLQGTEIESFVTQPITKNPRKKEPQLNPSKAKIKEKIDLAKTIQVAKKSLDPPPCIAQVKPSEHEECPYCGRSFGPKAFERHTEFCKEQHQKLKLTPTINNEAKERLKVRTSYRGPLTHKVLNRDRYQPNRNRDPSPMGNSLTDLRDEGGKSKGLMRNAPLRSSLRSRPTENVAPPPLRRTMTQINPPRSVRGSRDSVNEPNEKSIENNTKNQSAANKPRIYSRESIEKNSIICDVQSGSHRKKISDFTSPQSSPNKKFFSCGKPPLDLNDTSVNTFKELNVTSAKIEKLNVKPLPNKVEKKSRSKLPIFQRNKLTNSTNTASSNQQSVNSSDGKNTVKSLSTSFDDFSNFINEKVNILTSDEQPKEEKSLDHEYIRNSLSLDVQHLNATGKPHDKNHKNSNTTELYKNDSDSSVLSLTQSFGQTYESETKSIPEFDVLGQASEDEQCGEVPFLEQPFSLRLPDSKYHKGPIFGHSADECCVANNVTLFSHEDFPQVELNSSVPENSSICTESSLVDGFATEACSPASVVPDTSIESNGNYIFVKMPINEPVERDSFQLSVLTNNNSQSNNVTSVECSNDRTSDTVYNKFHSQQISESSLSKNLNSQFKGASGNNSLPESKCSNISLQFPVDTNYSSTIKIEPFCTNILGNDLEICDGESNSSLGQELSNERHRVDDRIDEKNVNNAAPQDENRTNSENVQTPGKKYGIKQTASLPRSLEHECNYQMKSSFFSPENPHLEVSIKESPVILNKNEPDLIVHSEIKCTLTKNEFSDSINMPICENINVQLGSQTENITYAENVYHSNEYINNFFTFDSCGTEIKTNNNSAELPADVDLPVHNSVCESQLINIAHSLDEDNSRKLIPQKENPTYLINGNLLKEHVGSHKALPGHSFSEKYIHENKSIPKISCVMNDLNIVDCDPDLTESIGDHVSHINESTCFSTVLQRQPPPEVMKIGSILNSGNHIVRSLSDPTSEGSNCDKMNIPNCEFPETGPPIDEPSSFQYFFSNETDPSCTRNPDASDKEVALINSINCNVEKLRINSVLRGLYVNTENIKTKCSIISSRQSPPVIEKESNLQDSKENTCINKILQSTNIRNVKVLNEPLTLPVFSRGYSRTSNAQLVLMRNIQNEKTLISFPLLEIETTIVGDFLSTICQDRNDGLADFYRHSVLAPLLYRNHSLNYLRLKENLYPKLTFQNSLTPRYLASSTSLESSNTLYVNKLQSTTFSLPQKVKVTDRPKTAPADYDVGSITSNSNLSLLVRNKCDFSLNVEKNSCTYSIKTNNNPTCLSSEYHNFLPPTNHLLRMSEELESTNVQNDLQQNKSKDFGLETKKIFCGTVHVHESSCTSQQEEPHESPNLICAYSESVPHNIPVMDNALHSMPAPNCDEEELVRRCSKLFESEVATDREGEALSQPRESKLFSTKATVPNSDISCFVSLGNLDTVNIIHSHYSERLDEPNQTLPSPLNSNSPNHCYFDFKLRELSVATHSGPNSESLDRSVFLEDETCDENQSNYLNGEYLGIMSNCNNLINNQYPGKNSFENTCSLHEENYRSQIFNDILEKGKDNCVTWQDIVDSNSSNRDENFGMLDTITEDSLEARRSNEENLYPEFDQTRILFWNDRKPYINYENDSYDLKQRPKGCFMETNCRRLYDGFHPEDKGSDEEFERDSLDSSSEKSILHSHKCRWNSRFNCKLTDRRQSHCGCDNSNVINSQNDNNYKNEYSFKTNEKKNTTHSRNLPPVIIYKKVSKQVKKIYENRNDQFCVNECTKIVNKSMKDTRSRHSDKGKELDFDSDWEFSDSSDDIDKENLQIYSKHSFESLEYNENEESNDCHTVKTSVYELPFCHKKLESSIKLPPLQSPNISFQTMVPKPSLVKRKSSKVDKLPPLGQPKSDAEKYNPYLSAERQMMELFGVEDIKPRSTLPEIPGTSPIQSTPTSAFVKYSSPKRSSSLESVKCDNKENNDNSIIIDTSQEEKVDNRRNFSLSNLSLCSVVSIDSIDCNKNSVNSRLLGGHLDDFQRSFSALEPKPSRTHNKTKVNLQEMLYGSQSPEHASHSESSNSDASNLEACEAELLISMLEFEKMLKGSPDPSPESTSPLCSSTKGDTPKASPRNNKSTFEKNQRNLNNSIDSAYSSLTRSSGAEGEKDRGKQSELPKFCHECGSKYPVAMAKFCCNCGMRRIAL